MFENQKSPSILKVLSVEKRQDSRINDEQPEGRTYHYIRVETVGDKYVDIPGVGKTRVKGESRQSGFVAYPNNYLDQKDPGADLQKGDLVLGDIVTRRVKPYELVGDDGIRRTLTQYSTVVLGDSTKEEQWEANIIRTFKRKRRTIVDTQPSVTITEEAWEEFDENADEMINNDLEAELVEEEIEEEEISDEAGF